MIIRDAIVEGSRNFDHLRFYNKHLNPSTQAFSIYVFIKNAGTMAQNTLP